MAPDKPPGRLHLDNGYARIDAMIMMTAPEMTAERAPGNYRNREDAYAEGAHGYLPAGDDTKLLVHGCEIW